MIDVLLTSQDREEVLSRVYARAVAAGAGTLPPTVTLTGMASIYGFMQVEQCGQRSTCS